MTMSKRNALIALVAVLLAAGGVFGYKKLLAKPGIEVLETARVERGDVRGVLVATGIVKPQVGALVKIGTRATGTIVSMKVKVGDRVSEGQLIALIDDREIRRGIEQQRAALLSAQNTRAQVELTYPERINEAQANYDYAKTTYEREQQLLKFEYTTRDAVDRARSQFEAAEATLKRLKDEYRTQLKIARANVDDRAAQLEQQQTRLTYTRIFAPIDGVVSDVTAQEGETTVAGLQVANLVTVLNPARLEMWIYVDETDIGRVKAGQQVEYYVDTLPDKLFHGEIERVNPQPVVKDNIVYYLAIVRVAKEDAPFLKPEMTTHVKVVFSERRGVLTVPNAAVKFERGKQVVYKLSDPKSPEELRTAEVKIGIRGEEKTEILSGAQEGDTVATKLVLPVAEPNQKAGGQQKR